MGIITYVTLALLSLYLAGCQKPITCEAGQFSAGEEASVTCFFPHTLEGTQHHIYVIQHPLNGSKDDPGKGILRCFPSSDQTTICEGMVEGLQFSGIKGDSLTFTFPAVTRDFSGNYLCQLVPPDNTVIATCKLTVQDLLPESGWDTKSDTDSERSGQVVIVVVPVAAALLIVLVIVTLVCIIRSRRRKRRRNATVAYSTPMLLIDRATSMDDDQSLVRFLSVSSSDQKHRQQSCHTEETASNAMISKSSQEQGVSYRSISQVDVNSCSAEELKKDEVDPHSCNLAVIADNSSANSCNSDDSFYSSGYLASRDNKMSESDSNSCFYSSAGVAMDSGYSSP